MNLRNSPKKNKSFKYYFLLPFPDYLLIASLIYKDVCLGTSYQNGGCINVEYIAPVNSYLSFPSVLKVKIE